ncbi:hypothetical protein U1Q18_037069 [Sarracenia purpurea var. burkii]
MGKNDKKKLYSFGNNAEAERERERERESNHRQRDRRRRHQRQPPPVHLADSDIVSPNPSSIIVDLGFGSRRMGFRRRSGVWRLSISLGLKSFLRSRIWLPSLPLEAAIESFPSEQGNALGWRR